MRNILGSLFLMAVLSGTTVEPTAGDWNGTLTVDKTTLHLALHVTAANKALAATFDSLDQQALGIRVDSITHTGKEVSFELKLIQANYTGTLQPDGKTIVGTWQQLGSSWPLTFHKGTASR